MLVVYKKLECLFIYYSFGSGISGPPDLLQIFIRPVVCFPLVNLQLYCAASLMTPYSLTLAVSYKSGRGYGGGGVWIFSGTTNSARGYFLYNSFLLLVVFTLRLYFVTF